MLNKLDHASSQPLHLQAEAALRELIGDYKPGELIPTEVDLADKLGISRNTLRQAINRLVLQGILVRKKGYGTEVAHKKTAGKGTNWMSFSQEMRSLGITVYNFEIHVSSRVPKILEISEFFGVSQDERLICLERLRGKKDLPFVYFFSYFNPSIGLNVNQNFTEPLYDILRRDFGVEVYTSKEEIAAMACPAHIATKLEIKEGSPILVRKRLVYDVNGKPVEYNVGYYRADSFTYNIEFNGY